MSSFYFFHLPDFLSIHVYSDDCIPANVKITMKVLSSPSISKFVYRAIFGSVLASSALLWGEPALGNTFSVGNSTGGTFVTDLAPPDTNPPLPFPGQSFTPSILGTGGSRIPPISGPILLNSFTLGDLNTGIAYVFDQQFAGTPTDLVTQVLGVNGFLGNSTSVSNGTYFFNSGILLNDVTAEYFVYLDTRVNIEFAEGNPYTGGRGFAADNVVDGNLSYVPGNDVGLDDPDLVFRADLTAVSVPEPSFTLGFMALGILTTGTTVLGRCREN
jgi:hypothetical protein